MSLTFGLALQNDFPPHVSPSARIGELREQVRAAREAGISSVWVLNHFLGNMQTLQPLPTLAALAEHAGDMRLGTNMFILPLRHPVAVATNTEIDWARRTSRWRDAAHHWCQPAHSVAAGGGCRLPRGQGARGRDHCVGCRWRRQKAQWF